MPPVEDDPDGLPWHVYLDTDGAMTFWHKFATREEAQRAEVGSPRRLRRVKVDLSPVAWGQTEECAQQGRVTSLSSQGCFLQTNERLRNSTDILLRLPLPTSVGETELHTLQSQVRYCLEGIGLGLVFTSPGPEERAALNRLINDLVTREEQARQQQP